MSSSASLLHAPLVGFAYSSDDRQTTSPAARLFSSPSQMGVMLHFRLRELQGQWPAKTIEFLSDGTVKFDDGVAHGSHCQSSSVVDRLVVQFHCKADVIKMKYHGFERIERTRLFMSFQEDSEWSTFITEFSVEEPFRPPREVEFVVVCPDFRAFWNVGVLKIDFATKRGSLNDTYPIAVEIVNEQSFSVKDHLLGDLTFLRFQHTKVYWSAGIGKNVVISITE